MEKKKSEPAMPPVDTIRGGNLAPGGPPEPKPEVPQYPSWRYNKDGVRSRLVKSEEEDAALGPEWGMEPVQPPIPPKPIDPMDSINNFTVVVASLKIRIEVLEKSVAALTESAGKGKR